MDLQTYLIVKSICTRLSGESLVFCKIKIQLIFSYQ